MLPYFWFILKVIACSGILFGYYWLFLRNKIFHRYNRFYLLSAIALSLLLPLVKIDFWQPQPEQSQAIRVLQAVSAGDEYMNSVLITANKNNWGLQQLYPLIYWMVCIVFLLVLLRTLFAIWSLLKRYPVQELEKVSFVNTTDKSTPFSFLKYIFWNDGIDMDTQTGKQIFKHEVAHIQEKHTHDKLFVNILLIFFWCNPFFWLYRKELNMIHEFIADKKAVEDSDTASFAAMILQATYPRHRFELTNNFFYSPIKRRLLMLTKNANPKVNYLGRVMVLPLAVLIFAAFTFKTKSNPSFYHGKKITVVIDAGHGGRDPGIKSVDGILEKDLTLAIAKKIKELNSNDAIEIILTREDDVYMDPAQKAAFAKSNNADLLISFHLDGAPALNEKSGMSFWVAKDQFANADKSKVLASSLIAEFSKDYGLTVIPVPQQRKAGIWILQASEIPAVLVEAGYISNTKDLAYLKTNEAKKTIAKNVLTAIEKFAVSMTPGKPVQNSIPVTDTIPATAGIFVNVKNTDAAYLKTDEFNNKALVIVDSKEIGNLGNNYLENSRTKFSTVVIYGPTEARKIYGEKGRYGVIKLTEKDIVSITAESVSYDEKNNTIRLGGSKTSIKGDLSGTLICVDGKIVSAEELNAIPPAKISSVNILKGDKLDDIFDAKGKTAVIYVSLKPADLPEVVVVSGKPLKELPVAIALDKMNVFYIGVENPITIAVPGISSDDLLVSIDNGSITGRHGKYIVRVTHTANATIRVATIKNNQKVLLSEQVFRVKMMPDPVNGKLPTDFDVKFRTDSTNFHEISENYKLQLEQQSKANLALAGKMTVERKLQEHELLALKQNFLLYQKNNINSDLAEKNLTENRIKYQELLTLNEKLMLEQKSKATPDQAEKQLLAKTTDGMTEKVLIEQKVLLKAQQGNMVFSKVEINPQFTGGEDAWKEYLQKNLKASLPVDEGWKAGKYTLNIKFIVRTDGTVSDVSVENYKGSKTAQHCIDIIKNAPKWQPAIQNGRKVNAYKKQPITFVIEE